MADAFDDRKKSFEAKFKLDEETKFKAQARRNKLLGLWLGEKFGLTEAEREVYGRELVLADMAAPGDEDLITRVMTDIRSLKATVTEAEVRKKLELLYTVAFEQVAKEQGKK